MYWREGSSEEVALRSEKDERELCGGGAGGGRRGKEWHVLQALE